MDREELVFMKPSEIRFSEHEIADRFADHGDIHQVILRLTLNSRLVNTIPTINVSNRNDAEWHTENNRRLYMFRVLERNGVLDKIQVNRALEISYYFVDVWLGLEILGAKYMLPTKIREFTIYCGEPYFIDIDIFYNK